MTSLKSGVVLGAALSLIYLASGCGDDGAATGTNNNGGAAAGNNGGSGASDGGLDISVGAGGQIQAVGGYGGGEVCASDTVTADRAPATMLFLIDRSGSMNCNLPPIQTSQECEANPQKVDVNEPSKWEVTSQALSDAFAGLENNDPLPSIGIGYFNSDNYCDFPTQPDVAIQTLSGDAATDAQLTALQTSLANVTPQGFTPIIGTVMGGYNFLYTNQATLDGILFVVLLTDGAETCDPDNLPLLVQKSGEAAGVGIRTFVLGAPGSESARAFLSQVAFNGETAVDPNCNHNGAPADVGDCHMDMTLPGLDFATELAANLETISLEALSCVFDVPEPAPGDPPVDLAKVNVKHVAADGGETNIPQDYSVACGDPSNMGWQYSADNSKITLCGEACEAVKNDPGATVTIVLGCQTQDVPQ